jgi:hypothetical protein
MQAPTPTQVYYVRSDTDRDHFYLVGVDDRGVLRCECKASQYRRMPCKHVRRVAAGSVRPARAKGTAVPTSTIVEPLPNGNTGTIVGTGPIGPTPARVTTTVVSDLFSDGGASLDRALARQRGVA